MGFYFRKSISAGPFRFNLSGSGVGMSVGVKGFRVGTGPRGNYVHMGRGGLYYRASLGGGRAPRPTPAPQYSPQPSTAYGTVVVETGNVTQMVPSSGTELLAQINEKMATHRLWPWVLILGSVLAVFVAPSSIDHNPGLALFFLTLVSAAVVARWDQSRRTVVVMYDLADDVADRFRSFCEAFDTAGRAARIWNIDTAAATADWKRNAGAGQLLTRKSASFVDAAPKVLKTNVSVPCITGGRQTLHFLPDVVLIVEGGRAGALSYEQFDVQWNTTVFIEEDGVPHDSHVVGYTWRFVNKNGSPDRRFNNNRQIPRVEYQQMGMQGGGNLRKLLHLSKVEDRAAFNSALSALRDMTRTLAAQKQSEAPPIALAYDNPEQVQGQQKVWIAAGGVAAIVVALCLYFLPPGQVASDVPVQAAAGPVAPAPATPAPAPEPQVPPQPQDPLAGQVYRGPGNSGNYDSDVMRVTTDFFRDLERSDGDAAAQFVALDRRERGPLSAAALTAKFSDLQEPLHLDNVSPVGPSRALALYSYMPASGMRCVGRALLTVEDRTGEYLIQTVRSRERCR